MHALVTGGGGFIGSHLPERILRGGHPVTVMLMPGEDAENLRGLDVRTVFCDILDKHALVDACAA